MFPDKYAGTAEIVGTIGKQDKCMCRYDSDSRYHSESKRNEYAYTGTLETVGTIRKAREVYVPVQQRQTVPYVVCGAHLSFVRHIFAIN